MLVFYSNEPTKSVFNEQPVLPTTPNAEPKTIERKRNQEKQKGNMYIHDKFCIMHTNIQSINGRKNSLVAIANSLNVDIVTINETNLKGSNNLKLEGFHSFNRNRKSGNMGGVATSIRDKYVAETLKVTEGKKSEFIVTRHAQFSPAINIINVYGSQESRQSSEEVKEEWEELLEEIISIESKEGNLILLGDTN